MKTLIITVFIMSAACILGTLPSFPPCPTEDSNSCYWDGTKHGNGQGRSFIALPDYSIIYFP